MNIMNNYLCAKFRRCASRHGGTLGGNRCNVEYGYYASQYGCVLRRAAFAPDLGKVPMVDGPGMDEVKRAILRRNDHPIRFGSDIMRSASLRSHLRRIEP